MKLASRVQKLERAITSGKSRLGLCFAIRVLKIEAEEKGGFLSWKKRERLTKKKNRPHIMSAPPEEEKVWRFTYSFYDEARDDLQDEYYLTFEEVEARYQSLKEQYPSDYAAFYYFDPSRRKPPPARKKEETR
jgi:hypothetical protein